MRCESSYQKERSMLISKSPSPGFGIANKQAWSWHGHDRLAKYETVAMCKKWLNLRTEDCAPFLSRKPRFKRQSRSHAHIPLPWCAIWVDRFMPNEQYLHWKCTAQQRRWGQSCECVAVPWLRSRQRGERLSVTLASWQHGKRTVQFLLSSTVMNWLEKSYSNKNAP